MSIPFRVLIVEDSKDDAVLLLRELRHTGYEPAFERVDTPVAMKAALDKQTWDVVIADYVIPGFGALAALAMIKEHGLDLPFIILSGAVGEDTAVAAMKAGAHDFLTKGNLARLGPAIERELRDAEMRRTCKQAQEALRQANEDLEAKIAERTRELVHANLQLKKVNHKLVKMSREDALTGLLNRRVILEIAAAEWTRWLRYVAPFSVMIIDLDDFKFVNDRYGHLIGDKVLTLMANTLNRSMRAVDKVGRYGGEEFVVIMPETGIDGAIGAGKNLLHNIRQMRLRTDDLSIRVTASIGVATVSLDDKSLDSVLHRADTALYMAKRQGKDRVVVSEQQLNVLPELLTAAA